MSLGWATGDDDTAPDHLTAAGDLVLEDVSLNVGGRWALERLSLAIHPGEVTALSGPSGSGKTTLLAIAGGIVKPTTGFASYAGQHTWQGDGDPRHEVAFVLQVYGLVPILSARENVAIALRARGVRPADADARADEELTRFHIGDLGDRQVEELSGGQMQRVACARAFAVSPEILLADEPTSELDEGNREHVMDQLRTEAARGAIVVVATHDPAVVEAADRRLVLDEGRLVEAGETTYANGR
jgi:putative ABC transport system ATP-binding protein